jgi:hypothetical protein
MHVREALEEQEREDVSLEVCRIYRTAQDVGGFPEMRFELIESDGVRSHATLPHELYMARRTVRHVLTAATKAQTSIVAHVLLPMVSLLLWCCPYYTPCAQLLLSEVVLARDIEQWKVPGGEAIRPSCRARLRPAQPEI